MKRRVFGLMSTCCAAALATGMSRKAYAANSSVNADLLKTTLTPMGSERAGNADGSIPAWTGGLTDIPAGWVPNTPMPDPFADEKPLFTINAGNMSQYADKLAAGTIALIQNQGMSLNVYTTHRTQALPQFSYDYIYQNALNATSSPAGARFGVVNAYGGYPFPIPDPSDPLTAGAQIMWNHQCKWWGEQQIANTAFYSVIGDQKTLLSYGRFVYRFPFFIQNGRDSKFNQFTNQIFLTGIAPANNAGAQELVWNSLNSLNVQDEAWEYLAGQGRVRKVPQVNYDIPEAQTNGLTFYDETWLFTGAMDKYDWKRVGKQEMYIPYNNNQVLNLTLDGLLPNYVDPAYVRWELHRVWVIDATLHPGERHVVAHRRLYVDEDTWLATVQDEWDANGNLWKTGQNFNMTRPDLPGTVYHSAVMYNFQQHAYVMTAGAGLTLPPNERFFDFLTVPADDLFNPQTMAERSQY